MQARFAFSAIIADCAADRKRIHSVHRKIPRRFFRFTFSLHESPPNSAIARRNPKANGNSAFPSNQSHTIAGPGKTDGSFPRKYARSGKKAPVFKYFPVSLDGRLFFAYNI